MKEEDAARQKYTFFDSFPEGCQVISPEFAYVYVNEAVAQQGKSSVEQLTGHTMMEKYPGIDETEVFAQIKACLETGEPHSMLNEFQFPDGSKGYFELRLRRVEEGVLILSEDVSEREKKFAENEKLMKFMLDRETRISELKKEIEELKKG